MKPMILLDYISYTAGLDFLPYKQDAAHPVASAPFKALKCFDFIRSSLTPA
jgi:hypothetical protein